MKNLTIIFSITMFFVFAGFNSAVPPPSGYTINSIGWDDSNCSCSEPVEAEVLITIIKISDQSVVSNSGWQTNVSQPFTYVNTTSNIGLDCGDPCYTVVVSVRLKDSGGICCSGYDSDNVSGEDLVSGNYVFPNDVILN